MMPLNINKIGIRERMVLIVFITGAIFGLLVTWHIQQVTGDWLDSRIQREGVRIAKSFRTQSESHLITENKYQLHRIIEQTKDNHPAVEYIFFQVSGDENNRAENVMVSSFETGVPEELLELNQATGNNYSIEPFEDGETTVYDIALPVKEGQVGTARIGISTGEITGLIEDLSRSVWFAIAGMLFGALILTFYLSRTVVSPIFQLNLAADKALEGQMSAISGRGEAPYEIDRLHHTILRLTDTLKQLRFEKETYKNQAAQSERLRKKLLSKTINAQEEERKKIARELHDETGQSLTTLKLALKQIEESDNLEDVKAKTQQLRDMTGDIIDEIKGIARDLRPSVLDDLGLEYALEKYLQDIEKNTQIKTEFYVAAERDIQLETEMATNIYRIVQESINNAVKHARPSKIEVICYKKPGKISMIIEDDGLGFDQDEIGALNEGEGKVKDQGLGLFGMKERAELIGGELTIDSQPGEGTRIHFQVQVDH